MRTATVTRATKETSVAITMDLDGRVTSWNPQAEVIFGWPSAEVMGKELADFIIPPALRDQHRKGLDVYRDTGKGPFIDRRVETTAVTADGREFPVEVSITRVPTVPPVFTGFVRDTTERVNAEHQRRDRKSTRLNSSHVQPSRMPSSA